MLKLATETLSAQCLKIYNFVFQNKKFLNAHMVDFITENHWAKLTNEFQCDLLSLQPGELLECFSNSSNLDKMKNFPEVAKFVHSAYDHSWQKMMACREANKFEESGILDKTRELVYNSSKHKIHQVQISNKKEHEVAILAQLVARLAMLHDVNLVVDFGTGKGYLSSLLAVLYELKVIGIESSEKNVCGATSRNKKLNSYFEQALKKVTDDVSSDSKGVFVPVTATLTNSTDLSDIIERSISDCKPFALRSVFCGLHTCGGLSCSVLKHFVMYPGAVAMCLLGCCYHMLEEMFGENDSQNVEEFGFPMSAMLRERKAVVGRNARMLAMQSVERQLNTRPSRSLFFRSLLQVLLRDHFGSSARHEVGRIPVKEDTRFESYVRQALKRLQLNHLVELSSETIESYVKDYSDWERKLEAYQELRILMAPSVELLLTLDRALYLMEQPNINSCSLLRLFDPMKSPRCLAIVAEKS